jgi:YHS domain-containing protein
VRFALLLLWLAAAAFAARILLRRLPLPARRAYSVGGDELVKDPVCQTYVVKSRAVRRTAGGDVTYFCSDECARRASRA